MKPEIVLFSKHLQWCAREELPRAVRAAGADGLDLTVRPGGHVAPERVEDELPDYVRLCRSAGSDVLMICTAIEKASDITTEKILKTAASLGIKYYRMGWLDYPADIRSGLDDIKSRLKDLAAMNEHYGIRGAYQNHDGRWFGAPVWDLARLLDEIDSPWLGVQYDVLNATIEGCKSWPLAYDFIKPHIHTIAVKDAVWRKTKGGWRIEYRPLGRGWMEAAVFIKKEKGRGGPVPFTMHFEYELGGAETGAAKLTLSGDKVIAAMKKDVAFLRRLWYETEPGDTTESNRK